MYIFTFICPLFSRNDCILYIIIGLIIVKMFTWKSCCKKITYNFLTSVSLLPLPIELFWKISWSNEELILLNLRLYAKLRIQVYSLRRTSVYMYIMLRLLVVLGLFSVLQCDFFSALYKLQDLLREEEKLQLDLSRYISSVQENEQDVPLEILRYV